MVREIITVNVGQCGIQMSNAIWKQYCVEHSIDNNGILQNKTESKHSLMTFFDETQCGNFCARNLSVDLESNVIDDIKNSPLQKLYNPDYLLNSKEDAANNFARGFYTVGREIIDITCDRLNRLVEKCDNLQGIIVNHSVGGGTGSGLGSLILEKMAVSYKNKAKIGMEVYPSANLCNCITEPYNAMFCTSYLCDTSDVNILLDNEAMYQKCQSKQVNIKTPDYKHINTLVAKISSSLTASLRFKGELNTDINDFQTNLVPFPRLKFMITSMSPIIRNPCYLDSGIPKSKQIKSDTSMDIPNFTVRKIADLAVSSDNFLVNLKDGFDVENDRFMSILLNFRGNVNGKDSNAAVQWLKQNNKVQFVEWCPTGFRVGLNNHNIKSIENDMLAETDKNAMMVGNNVCVAKSFRDSILRKSDILYSQRAFVHWYVGEGMEESEFDEAREQLTYLEKDYMQVLNNPNSDDEENHTDNDEY